MQASLALFVVLAAAYLQSGLPGLAVLELVFVVVKQDVFSWLKRQVTSGRGTGTGGLGSDVDPGSDTPVPPVSVQNQDVDCGDMNIEVNLNFYTGAPESESTVPVSDGGERQEDVEEKDSEH